MNGNHIACIVQPIGNEMEGFGKKQSSISYPIRYLICPSRRFFRILVECEERSNFIHEIVRSGS